MYEKQNIRNVANQETTFKMAEVAVQSLCECLCTDRGSQECTRGTLGSPSLGVYSTKPHKREREPQSHAGAMAWSGGF